MKLMLIIYSGTNRQLVPALLDRHEAGGYTELTQALGAGQTGRRLGTRAWPGNASIVFSIVPDERVEALATALREEAGALGGDERLHVATMPVESFF
jgi:hypothetical protein